MSSIESLNLAPPPAYSPAIFVPLYAPYGKYKRFYFVSVSNISYIRFKSDTNTAYVQLAIVSQRKDIELQIPPDITFKEYVKLFTPNFIVLGSYAVNPTNILEIYPSGNNSTKIDVACQSANRSDMKYGNETESIDFKASCSEIISRLCKQSHQVGKSYFSGVDIGFGQVL
ncbi:hypothetical protein HDV06_001649 [Boothiomyces sp. JEL0866]|nr:hypothetical protein HDV06_001649 [Boothiomyces sp. JEL0866]